MKTSSGFSLIEIAVVMIIIAILFTVVGLPISAQIELRRIDETKKQIESIKETILGFAIINGRLPCPALNSGVCTVGRECFCSEGTSTNNSGACTLTMNIPIAGGGFNGRCAAFGTTTTAVAAGLLPAMTLGVTPTDPNGYALDGFATPTSQLRYAVARTTVNSVLFPLTRVDGIKSATMDMFGGTTPPALLTVCPPDAPACTGATALTPQAPFVVFSLGNNSSTPFASLSNAEKANLDNDTGGIFVSGTPLIPAFDDILSWSSINILFARMLQAGKLP